MNSLLDSGTGAPSPSRALRLPSDVAGGGYPVVGCWMNVRLCRAVLEVKVICRGEGQALRVGVHGPRPTLPAIWFVWHV